MKTLLKDLAVFLLILVLGVTGCAAPAIQPPPTQPPAPEAIDVAAVNPLSDVVLKMVERLNAGDLEGSLDYFADDFVTYFVGMPPTGMEIYRGKEGIRPIWEECIGSHFKMDVEIVSVVGDVVNARSKTWHDFTRQLGVAPNEFVETYVVKDGKIVRLFIDSYLKRLSPNSSLPWLRSCLLNQRLFRQRIRRYPRSM